LVVVGGGWWWLVVVGGGWWWLVVVGGGWWWCVCVRRRRWSSPKQRAARVVRLPGSKRAGQARRNWWAAPNIRIQAASASAQPGHRDLDQPSQQPTWRPDAVAVSNNGTTHGIQVLSRGHLATLTPLMHGSSWRCVPTDSWAEPLVCRG
jgi:hypothetical protein